MKREGPRWTYDLLTSNTQSYGPMKVKDSDQVRNFSFLRREKTFSFQITLKFPPLGQYVNNLNCFTYTDFKHVVDIGKLAYKWEWEEPQDSTLNNMEAFE